MQRVGAASSFETVRGELWRGCRIAATTLLTAAMLTGATGFATADPVPGAPPAPAPAPAPAPGPAPAPAPSAALFTLTAMPAGWQTRTDLHPALEIQSDGHATKWPGDGATQPLNGTIPQDVLGAATAEVRQLALVDMGMPTVVDKSTSIIDFMPQPPDQDAHVIVYAPELTDGLTDDQKASRKRFTDLFQRLLNAFVQG
ncbi:hypothetical protein ACIP5Y_30235 [Nocardia sp. NPDC088792]|uniref:hypothetical protein n=1 Tax=Nocardia sp. NPDC088792 TaxID=3364332 RepID=UPI00380675AC